MAAPLSIVVPTLNAQDSLPSCLSALVEGVVAGVVAELIVTDGGSEDETLRIADEAGAMIVTGAASRGGQLQRGASQARGTWLLVVHADTVLDPGWSRAVAVHMREEARPAYFKLAFDARGFWPGLVAGWANLRSSLFGLPYGDQGLLLRRDAYERAGGYPDQPLMEDVHLVRALGRDLVRLDACAVTSAVRYRRVGWLRRGVRNLWTLARYFAGVSPERLAAAYRR